LALPSQILHCIIWQHLGLFKGHLGHPYLLLYRITTYNYNMLERLGSILGFRPLVQTSQSIARFFSISRVYGKTPEDPQTPKKLWPKLRYHNDAAFRDKIIAHTRAWQAKHRDQFLQATRARARIYRKDAVRVQNKKDTIRKAYHEKYSKDPVYMHRVRLYTWVRTRQHVIPTLPWKTHRPLYYETKVEHFCQGCQVTEHGGKKLWWLRLGSDDQYDCHFCYAKDIDASMPEGYEGITTWRGILARKEELDRLGQSDESKP
jgi:hypothetical protein